MAREGIGQAQFCCELGAEEARPQHPELGLRAKAGCRMDRGLASHQCHQLGHILWEHLGRAVQILAQRALKFGAGAGRAPEPKIDATRKQRIECAELLGNLERRVVGQHDPARADADGRGGVADMREHDRGRAPGNALHRVMFCNPEALAADLFRRLCQARRCAESVRYSAAFAHGDEVENGKIGHSASCSR